MKQTTKFHSQRIMILSLLCAGMILVGCSRREPGVVSTESVSISEPDVQKVTSQQDPEAESSSSVREESSDEIVSPESIKETETVTVESLPMESDDTETETPDRPEASSGSSIAVNPPAPTESSSASQAVPVPETAPPAETTQPELAPPSGVYRFDGCSIEQIIAGMTLEEKVAQLFVIVPESLTSRWGITEADDTLLSAINQVPVGGFIFMENNLQSTQQSVQLLSAIQQQELERLGLPAFFCVDEEGGRVLKIGGRDGFGIAPTPAMSQVGAGGDTAAAAQYGRTIGSYLKQIGFQVDFAPVADVLSNPANTVVKDRSFGTDPVLVAGMIAAFSGGLREQGVFGTLKHFPGHGCTEADTHQGFAYSNKTLEELYDCELLPFIRGAQEGVPFIMAGHISFPNIVGDNTPATLSELFLTQVLRQQIGYQGIVITDAMNMGAIVQYYSSADAAIKAIQAGADLVLMPADFYSAYQGVLSAVQNQQISQERINESLRRILQVKLQIKG